ncbi:MAG TPA: cytochrome c oxidase subunit 3 [Terriglobales bacterium]|nr:cytochrome c oxidase subunit 3 [Terriglobales bacterium]
MGTVVHEPPRTQKGEPRSSGGNGWRNLAPAQGTLRGVEDHSPPPSKTGVWVGIAAITMSFAALTSALVVRQGGSTDWRHFALPTILYFNTLLLVASSFTLERARHAFKTSGSGPAEVETIAGRWLYATLSLGLLFVAGQYIAWLQLKSQGLFLATNPSSSFFYVLTAVHALHVIGGLGGILYVISKLNRYILRKSTLDAASHYWHFMDGLWLYLFVVLWIKL